MRVCGNESGRLCPLIAFDRMAGGKYKLRILWELGKEPKRYGVLRSSLVIACQGSAVTPRTLSRELKELESLGFIRRKQFPVVPPKVEYSLTDRGRAILPIIVQIIKWGMTGAHEAPPRRGTGVSLDAALR
jgi:DNA-binding HxlR family transcriptional regulator